jgi:hypothetical protein
MIPRIVDTLSNNGVEVQHIPGGCTGMCQPIDVGIGKPLKSRVRNLWEDWMMEQGIHTEKFRPPPRETMADWVVSASATINEQSFGIVGDMGNLHILLIRNQVKHNKVSLSRAAKQVYYTLHSIIKLKKHCN